MQTRRALIGSGLALGAGAMLGLPLAASAQGVAGDPRLAMVNPELRPMAKAILGMNMPKVSAANLASQREGARKWAAPQRADIPVEQRTIPGRAGQPDVVIFIVNAAREGARPAILHTHGGGFVSGRAADGVRMVQDFAAELGCVIVSVEYRLAPETRWSGSLEDNYAGLMWLHANAASLGVDPARIAVMGESAGGGHAALLALAARDRGEVPLVFQCLTYPMLDDRTGSTRMAPAHVGHLIWTPEANRFGWESFLGMAPGGRRVPAAAVPARRSDLAGLPPAFIGVGSLDLFLDEDIDYARRLNDAGVAAELVVVPGAFHGFDGIGAGTRIGSSFNALRLAALKAALNPA